ncbi:glycerol uptake facilitator protein [Actinorhabdospora filicis]|uniref:Glycerol uptake facilitator protein n=1 Tax=Actinorhabdospora filicis TaxID=1785913 RepID=A0A9W6SR32_9ACTN|nr:aquaporin [Actinorhabdospora filicis]GLZ80430.1 glycerol uptake facilitator protein [Actinorhabdospora filicis]
MGPNSISRLSAEGLGTLLLTYTLAFASAGGVDTAIASAGALAFLYWLLAGASGAHLNPIVSLSLAVRGKLGWVDAALYTVAQLVGALLGGLLLWASAGDAVKPAFLGTSGEVASGDLVKALVGLAIGAFLLVGAYVAFEGAERLLAGLAVGTAFGLAALTGATGVNLAKVVGADLTYTISGGSVAWASIWVWIVGPLVGGVLAAFAVPWVTSQIPSATADAE